MKHFCSIALTRFSPAAVSNPTDDDDNAEGKDEYAEHSRYNQELTAVGITGTARLLCP